MLNGDEEALDGLGEATIRMLKKGMGVEYTQTAMDDNTWKCEHDTRLKKARRSAAGLQTKTLQSTQGKLR